MKDNSFYPFDKPAPYHKVKKKKDEEIFKRNSDWLSGYKSGYAKGQLDSIGKYKKLQKLLLEIKAKLRHAR